MSKSINRHDYLCEVAMKSQPYWENGLRLWIKNSNTNLWLYAKYFKKWLLSAKKKHEHVTYRTQGIAICFAFLGCLHLVIPLIFLLNEEH